MAGGGGVGGGCAGNVQRRFHSLALLAWVFFLSNRLVRAMVSAGCVGLTACFSV